MHPSNNQYPINLSLELDPWDQAVQLSQLMDQLLVGLEEGLEVNTMGWTLESLLELQLSHQWAEPFKVQVILAVLKATLSLWWATMVRYISFFTCLKLWYEQEVV
jgi:hypothetical protein